MRESLSWFYGYIFITVYHCICNHNWNTANLFVDVGKLLNYLKYYVTIFIYLVLILYFHPKRLQWAKIPHDKIVNAVLILFKIHPYRYISF